MVNLMKLCFCTQHWTFRFVNYLSHKNMDDSCKDVINNLPDYLLCQNLSNLTTQEAALTSVLSKRCRYLLAFVPNLVFDDEIYDDDEMGQRNWQEMRTSFQVFVDRVMALQGNASVNKFSLRCVMAPDPSSVNRWILNVLERGVVDLDLYIPLNYDCLLPSEVLMSKTLVRLKVGANELSTDMGEVFLPKLKTLYLEDVALENGDVFAKLISGCPVLEELVMIEFVFCSCDFFLVSSPTLKRLKVCCENIEENPKSISFDTPNIVHLVHNDPVAVKYPKVNFDSLVEASLHLQMSHYPPEDTENATDLFLGICNVEILYLSATTLEILAFRYRATPVFNNLIYPIR